MRGVVALSLCVALLVPGCAAPPCTAGPLVSARGIGPGTPAEAGDGPIPLTVTIQDPAGGVLAGAGVVAYWNGALASKHQADMARPEVGGPGVQSEPGHSVGTPGAATTLRVRTGADGRATLRVPGDMLVGLVAAKEGWTEEWVGFVATGTSGSLRQSITLYPTHVRWDVNTTWAPAALSDAAVGGTYDWLPSNLAFAGSPDGYLHRMVRLVTTVTWDNAPTAFGDLAAGVGASTGDPPSAVGDASHDVATGPRTETLDLGLDALRQLRLQESGRLAAGPATGDAMVAPLGLAVHLHVEATLDRAQADAANCLYVAASDGGTSAAPASQSPGSPEPSRTQDAQPGDAGGPAPVRARDPPPSSGSDAAAPVALLAGGIAAVVLAGVGIGLVRLRK